jgi:phage gp36-like protein
MAYCEDTDMNARYGLPNLNAWADMEGLGPTANATAIAARKLLARNVATARIDDRLRGSGVSFKVPITGTVPATIVNLCVKLAAYELESALGYKDYVQADERFIPVTRLYPDRQDALDTLEMIVTGKLTVNFDG